MILMIGQWIIVWINDQIINDTISAKEFLSSLGLDKWDIEEFCQMLLTNSDAIDWKKEAKEWELDSMQQFEKRNSLINEINELADKLESGKGGTKKQYAERLRQTCEFWY